MPETATRHDDEIDLVELAQTVWDGKWKVVGAVVISLLSVFGYQSTQPPPSFEASTEIKPITSVDAEKYRKLNALGFFEVTPNRLLRLYIEQLNERKFFEESIRKYGLLDSEKFDDKQAFDDAVITLASTIEILPPINVDGTEIGDIRRFWTIRFEYNDDDKWKKVILSVDTLANKSVQQILQQQFQTSLSVAKQTRDFELEDIKTLMANAKRDFEKEMEEFELKQGFQLEDIQTQIDNALADYDRKTTDRLAFLREQASIARELGVAKNTIETQTFSAQNAMVANVTTDTPFYLHGYEAIEKEIELIESRENKKAFVGGLFELEQNRRGLEQDRTLQRVEKNKAFLESLIDLEKKQRQIEQNKSLERAEILFASTPIGGTDDFSAVSLTVQATEFKLRNKRMLMLPLSVVIGAMIGAVFVLMRSAFRKRKATHDV